MKIEVNFWIPTKDFKKTVCTPLSVEMVADFDKPLSGQFEYKVKIPDFMFEELANSEPQFKTEYDQNNSKVSGCFGDRELTRKFKKTQTAKSIDTLKEYFNTLSNVLLKKYSLQTLSSKKKIFISFKHSANHHSNSLNSAYKGEFISQSFNYFIGYEVELEPTLFNNHAKKDYITKIEYHPPNTSLSKRDSGFQEVEGLSKTLLSQRHNIKSFESEYCIIDWSEEREEFCKKIQETFKKINLDLDTFLQNIDNEKIDNMILTGNFKLLK